MYETVWEYFGCCAYSGIICYFIVICRFFGFFGFWSWFLLSFTGDSRHWNGFKHWCVNNMPTKLSHGLACGSQSFGDYCKKWWVDSSILLFWFYEWSLFYLSMWCNSLSFYLILETLRVYIGRKSAIWYFQWLHFGLIFFVNTLLSFVHKMFVTLFLNSYNIGKKYVILKHLIFLKFFEY